MQKSYYIIQKHVFDIRCAEKEKAIELQNRFSRLFYDQAEPVMEEVFGRRVPEGIVLRVETMALDIGRLRYDRIEKDFAESFREALEKEMERVLNDYARQEAPGWTKSLTELLEYFLISGSLPWWAAGELMTDPVAVTEMLVRDDRPGLRKVLLAAGQRDYVRRRMVFQFPGGIIRSMIEVLEPEEASFIFVYHSDIIRIQEAGQVFRQEINEFEKDIWIFIFTYLLVDRGSNFNRKIFVKSAIGQMARRWNLEYAVLLGVLFRALEAGSPALAVRSSLSGIIHTLYYEEEYEPVKNLPAGPARLVKEKMDRIRHYLLNGSLSGAMDGGLTVGALLYDVKALSQTFTQLMALAPDATQEMIRQLSGQEGLWTRIINAFDEGVVSGLIRLREPNEADFILHYGKKLEILQREKSLVKTQGSSFYQSVWELILIFLWMERGNLFNTRVFLEYNIRRMALRYHLSYRQLLAFLVQGIGQDIRSDKDSSLFQSLAFLLKENSGTPIAAEAGMSTGAEAGMHGDMPVDSRGGILSARRTREIIEYWLLHDGYPSWAPRDESNSPAQLLAKLLEEDPEAVVALLRYAGGRAVWQQRMLYRLPINWLISSFRLLPGGSWALSLYEEAARVPGNRKVLPIGERTIRAELLRMLWEAFKESDYRSFDSAVYIEKSLHYLSSVQERDVTEEAANKTKAAQEINRPDEEIRKDGDEAEKVRVREAEQARADKVELAAIAGELERRMVRDQEEKRKRDATSVRTGEETIYIHNAGLVLLHPLLAHFFRRLGLTEKDQFINEEAQQRSAHLLQFLVNSRQEHPEQELVLNKILCEIPIEEPLALRITITEKEMEVAKELMEVLRLRWKKMENSSVEALQLSFLQRSGGLSRTHDGWKLRVEQKGVDVLLPYLSWSWGMIKLPWMSKILYVEWI